MKLSFNSQNVKLSSFLNQLLIQVQYYLLCEIEPRHWNMFLGNITVGLRGPVVADWGLPLTDTQATSPLQKDVDRGLPAGLTGHPAGLALVQINPYKEHEAWRYGLVQRFLVWETPASSQCCMGEAGAPVPGCHGDTSLMQRAEDSPRSMLIKIKEQR